MSRGVGRAIALAGRALTILALATAHRQTDAVNHPTPLAEPPAPDALTDLSGPQLRRAMSYVTIAWMFGAIWMHALAGAPLTVFATQLGLSEFQFGLLSAMPFAAALLSLPAASLTDRTGQRKRIFLFGLYPNRVLWIVVGVVPTWMVWRFGPDASALAIGVFLFTTFLIHAGQGIGSPAWTSWMADIVPDRVRGRYFARRRQWGILTAIPAALGAGWTLDYFIATEASGMLLMGVCTIIFSISAVFGVVDIVLFHFVPHAVRPKPRVPFMAMIATPLRDRRFMWFSACTAILWFSVAGQGQFVSKYLIDHLKISSTQTQMMLLVTPLLTQLLVLPIWGRAIDRYGKKPSMLLAVIGIVPVGVGWVLMNSGQAWLGYVLACVGAAWWTGVEVSNFNLVLELSGTGSKGGTGGSAYMAINAAIINIAGMLGGVFYGIVAESLRMFEYDLGWGGLGPLSFYEVLFAISAVLRLAAVLPLLRVHEPEARPTVDLLRFMAGNLYNNVAGAVLLPVRLIRRDDREDDDDLPSP